MGSDSMSHTVFVWKRLALAVALFTWTGAMAAHAQQNRPFRGDVGISVLLCHYNDAPVPSLDADHYRDRFIKSGTGGHADYWRDVSYGSLTMNGSVVRGWYRMDQTAAQAREYGQEGKPGRLQKHGDCVAKARLQGYVAPANHLVVVVTSPDIDTFGFRGGAFVGEGAGIGIIAHEVGHGIGLEHSFSTNTGHCPIGWQAQGEYDDQWDVMSFANVFARATTSFGLGGPGLNAYHLDRMGWLDRNRILRFGADGVYDRTVTVTTLSRESGDGFHLVRIPFDASDLNRYYTVEYRVAEEWDSAIPSDTVLIHEIDDKPVRNCGSGEIGGQPRRSYLQRGTGGAPWQDMDLNGVRIQTLSRNAAAGTAQVRIVSDRPSFCRIGFVWREATPGDRVCVPPARRTEVRTENTQAAARRQPGGGAYGPDTCRQGFVWREAGSRTDHVCVPVASRTAARAEDAAAWERRLGGGSYGPNTCKAGTVWRETDARDWVCVTSARRTAVREENRQAAARRQPGGGSFGLDTCRSGFVWRDAFPGDHVCVLRASRTEAARENLAASANLADRES